MHEAGHPAAVLRDVAEHGRGVGRGEPAPGNPAGTGRVAQTRVAELVSPPGKLADLVVLRKDIFKAPPREILTTPVDMTVVGGRVVLDQGER